MGSSGSGKDNLGADYRQQAGNSFLYAQCRDQRCEGCTRRDRACQEQPLLLASQSHPLHRRDTPFQQVAARLAVGSRGARHRDADRRHHGEPFVRGHPPATVPLPALYPEVTGEGRPAGTAATRHHHGHRAEGTENRTERNHCHAPLQRRRRPQAAQHPRTGDRFRSHRPCPHHRRHGDRTPATEPSCLR